MKSKTYRYSANFKIIVTCDPGANGITHAEVRQGSHKWYAGTPYQCLHWLADIGDRRAQAQLVLLDQVNRLGCGHASARRIMEAGTLN